MVQTFKRNVGKILEGSQYKNIPEAVQTFLMEYRAFPCIVTGESPGYRMFKREIRTAFDKICVRMMRSEVNDPAIPSLHRVAPQKEFVIGESVWVSINKKWMPAIIVGKTGDRIYEVSLADNTTGSSRPVHVDYIKTRR